MTEARHRSPEMPVAVYRGRGRRRASSTARCRTPGPGQVLVEVSHCGICGSDLHLMVEGWGKPGLVGGHEFTGVIAAVGDGVADWAVGDEIVGGASPRCGRCRRCLEGKPSQCENRRRLDDTDDHDGAFARYIARSTPRSLLASPTACRSRRRRWPSRWRSRCTASPGRASPPATAPMVIGAGPIGALTIAALVARGFDRRRPRSSPARAAGSWPADLGADARASTPTTSRCTRCGNPNASRRSAVDVVLECSGKKAAMEAGLQPARAGAGVLVLVGAGIEPPTFDPNRMILNELTISGSFVYDADGFERALELLASGALPTDLLIDPTTCRSIGLGDAMGGLADGRIAGKAMVVPRCRPARRLGGRA